MTARISIAMATFNGAAFLAQQLDSFAAQTLLPDELVITDDGSTDATIEILEQFAKTAPFTVRVHRNAERLGYSRNFEAAIARSAGDIVFLSDQDDVWFPDKLETVAARFEADGRIQVVFNGQIVTDGDLRHGGVTMLDNVRRLGMTSDALIEGCCTAFRKGWGEILLPIPAKAEELVRSLDLSHDRWLNELSILLRVRIFIEQPLQYFRRYGGNATQWIGNAPRAVGLSNLITTRLRQAPAGAWLRRVQALDVYREWLTVNRSRLEEFGIDHVDDALQALEQEKLSRAARAALVHLPLGNRLPRIWRLWRRGGYKFFYGWKSALRDVTRSPELRR